MFLLVPNARKIPNAIKIIFRMASHFLNNVIQYTYSCKLNSPYSRFNCYEDNNITSYM